MNMCHLVASLERNKWRGLVSGAVLLLLFYQVAMVVLPFACSVDVVGGICVASVWLCRVLVPVLCRYAVLVGTMWFSMY